MAKLHLFASLRELAGTSVDELEAHSVGELIEVACEKYGERFREVVGFSRTVVNHVDIRELSGNETPLVDSDEVALLPPVSGGTRD